MLGDITCQDQREGEAGCIFTRGCPRWTIQTSHGIDVELIPLVLLVEVNHCERDNRHVRHVRGYMDTVRGKNCR